jgi:NAD(P)-dependent dehydrogenase (short-subunit alcohol dehydrogenase family)
MPTNLTAKVALVTGASRGIGEAVARGFSRAGAAVVLAARNTEALERVSADIRGEGGQTLVVSTDVADQDAVAHMIEQVIAEFGRLDFACNNAAGGGHPPTPLADVPVEAFDSGIAVSLRGVFLCLRAEIPAMLQSGGGAIVNVSSTAGLQGVGGLATYVAAKHGLEGLTKVAALDYAAQGIRVNAIAPGPILTGNLARAGPQAQQGAAAALPLQRVGEPDEVAAAVLWLCSNESGFITGSTLTIDGGRLAGTPPFNVTLRPSQAVASDTL